MKDNQQVLINGGDIMYNKYLITGASGFLGRNVIKGLLDKKAEIRALIMRDDPLEELIPSEVQIIYGNVCDVDSMRDFFENSDCNTCVIHCAGIVSVASNPEQRIYDVNVGGTKNIISLCEKNKVGKLIYVSSVHAIPEKPKGIEITEDACFLPDLVEGDYAKSKSIATSLVLKAAKRGLDANVVFPSGIIGPGDNGKGSITSMLLSFISGKLPLAVKGGYDFVDVRDVAYGIISCSEKGLPGRGYILSGHYASIKNLLDAAKSAINLKRLVSYLPIWIAKVVAPLYEKWSILKKRPLFFTPQSVAVLDSNGKISHEAATKAFGYDPRSIKSSINDTVRWLVKNVLKQKATVVAA